MSLRARLVLLAATLAVGALAGYVRRAEHAKRQASIDAVVRESRDRRLEEVQERWLEEVRKARVPTRTAVEATRLAGPPPREAALEPGKARIAGRVVDAAGAPVADAIISLVDPPARGIFVSYAAAGPTRTATDGRFALDVAPGAWVLVPKRVGYRPVGRVVVTATAGAAVEADVPVERVGSGWVRIRAQTRAGGAYEGDLGLVARPTGGLAERAELYLDADATGLARSRDDGVTLGRAAGTELELTAGTYALEPRVGSHEWPEVPVEVRDGATTDATVVVEALPVLEVRVVADDDGKPVPDATVRVWPETGPDVGQERTDERGVARVSVWPGTSSISVGASGFRGIASPAATPEAPGVLVGVTIDDALLRRGLDVRLARTGELNLRIVGPDGRPVAATVRVQADPGGGNPNPAFDTGPDGRLHVPSVGSSIDLDVRAEGFGRVERTIPVPDDPAREVEVVLRPAARLRVRVRVPDAKAPLPVVEVWARPADGPEMVCRQPFGEDPSLYRFVDLAAGPALLGIDPRDGEPYAPVRREVTLVEGDEAALDVVLDAGKRIAGRLVRPDGAPPEVTRFSCTPAGAAEPVRSTESPVASPGTFSFEGLADGAYDLRVRVPGFVVDEPRGVRAGTEDLVIPLRRAATLEVRVLCHDGQPLLQTVGCTVHAPGGPPRSLGITGVDSRGRAVFDDVDAAATRVAIEPGGHAPRELAGLRFAAGEMTAVTVEVGERGTVRGRIVDEHGRPVGGARVTIAWSPDEPVELRLEIVWPSLWHRTDAQGRFRFLVGEGAPLVVATKGEPPNWRIARSAPVRVERGKESGEVLVVMPLGAPAAEGRRP